MFLNQMIANKKNGAILTIVLVSYMTLFGGCSTPTEEVFPTSTPSVTVLPTITPFQVTFTPSPRPGIDYPVQIMPLGDSITEGTCDAPENCNLLSGFKRPTDGSGLSACNWALNPMNPNGYGYRGFLKYKLAAQGFQISYVGSVSVVDDYAHEGHSGWTIRDIDFCVQNADWLLDAQPYIILLHIGTNDGNQSRTSDQMAADLTLLLEHIYEKLPETTNVIVAQLIPVANYASNASLNKIITLYNYKIPEVVKNLRASGKHVSYVNMADVIQVNAEFDRWGIHPNKIASERMADVWLGKIIEILKQPH